jgi:hypothetical protein
MEIAKPIEPGFSTADAESPEIRQEDGDVRLRFKDWQERIVEVFFADAIAHKWESIESFYEGERNDSSYEILGSSWIAEHVQQRIIKESAGYKHYKLNFNAWGQFEVLAKGYTTKTSQALRADAL